MDHVVAVVPDLSDDDMPDLTEDDSDDDWVEKVL